VQTDDFSCGFHALSAIYRSYHLDPAIARLRARLGTSRPAIPFVSGSNGTLQPDLFRVLQQDGFEAETIHPRDPEDRRKLVLHLYHGHYALALLKTERAGGLHWVVFTGQEDGVVTVADSLRRGLQEERLDELTSGPLLSVILLRPGQPAPGSPYYEAHASGLAAMIATTLRSAPPGYLILFCAFLVLVAWLVLKLLRTFRRRLQRPAAER
jgi:ABC-type bacteriocin/lantibiotic exporter with double-glycine peptidase domain